MPTSTHTHTRTGVQVHCRCALSSISWIISTFWVTQWRRTRGNPAVQRAYLRTRASGADHTEHRQRDTQKPVQPELRARQTMASSRVRVLAPLCALVLLGTFIGSTHSGKEVLTAHRWKGRTRCSQNGHEEVVCVCVCAASCCMMYSSRRWNCQRMMGYSIQTIIRSCDINAVM